MSEPDPIIEILKKRYFDLIPKEQIGKTPEISAELDHIELGIKKLREEKELTGRVTW